MRSETFALFCGVACLSLGLFGLSVNLPDSVVYLAIGAWGITAWRRWTGPRAFSATLAIVFGALALMGLIPGLSTLFGMLPLQGLDIWLHGGTAVLAAYFAWRPELSAEHRASSKSDRREKDLPVAEERRRGHVDRRLPSASEEI
jgi:hypothetical protein